MQLCPSCGASLPDEARFCGQCGRFFDTTRTVQPRGTNDSIVQAKAPTEYPAPIKRHTRQPYRSPSSSTDARPQPGVSRPPAASIPTVPNAKPFPAQGPVGVGGPYTNGRPRRRMSRKRKIILWSVLIFFLLVGGGVAYGVYYIQGNILGPVSQFIHQVSRGKDEPPIPSYDESSITSHSWNILLMGSDNDGKYNFPALLTQVMLLVHIDPVQNQVWMVSIPRDSWVNVPDIGGMHKIDQAFILGATQHNSFDDGVRQARLTVEKDYGVTIDRYAWVGLSGFASVIDTLGGVDIDVTHPIVDDTYPDDTGGHISDPYAYERLYLAPGPQHLTGAQALEYVRSRHADLIGDIGRTQRQQQVLTALKKKLTVTTLFSHLKDIIADLQGKVYTDLSETEMLAFANFGRSLSDTAVQRLTLGPGQGSQDYGDLSNVYDPSVGAQQSVVIPNCANIQPAINRIFALGNAQSCNVNGA
jgi:polyisoprenyl-teichoic acid--peptidoglycan teichoic acid transferase